MDAVGKVDRPVYSALLSKTLKGYKYHISDSKLINLASKFSLFNTINTKIYN